MLFRSQRSPTCLCRRSRRRPSRNSMSRPSRPSPTRPRRQQAGRPPLMPPPLMLPRVRMAASARHGGPRADRWLVLKVRLWRGLARGPLRMASGWPLGRLSARCSSITGRDRTACPEASVPVAAGQPGGVVWSGHGGSVLARGRGSIAGLRVARWVADRCLRALFRVARRCSPLAFPLVTPHRCWSAEVPGLHGMQEVSGSSPLSSTQVRSIFRTAGSRVQQESTATAASWAAVCVFESGMFPGWDCWQDTGSRALNRRWSACHLGKSPSHGSGDFCHLVTTPPSWRAIPARDCCRICK